MKSTFTLTFSLFLLASMAVAQVKSEYDRYAEEATVYNQNKDFLKAAQSFSKAFAANKDLGRTDHRYQAACSWAMAGQPDSAFYQLKRIANHGYFADYKTIANNEALALLHSDPRWPGLIVQFKEQEQKRFPNRNFVLLDLLDTVYKNDQDYRLKIEEIERNYGLESPEMTENWKVINHHDSINLIKVEEILEKHGWLGADVVGQTGSSALFLVVQHAPLASQEKYLPMMRKAVLQGRASSSSLALLEDRVALRRGGKQIYGSQIGRNLKTGAWYVLDLEDPANVDKRRAEVNLPPMAEYLKRMGIEWSIPQYQKALAENRSSQ